MKLNLKVPTSWADITIKQFCEWNYLAENCGGKLNNLEDILNALVILLDTDKENLRKLNSKQISKLLESLEFLVKPIPNLPLEKTIVIHGVTYACDLDMRSFSTGQYIDLTDILKDKDNLKNRINEVLACLFIPLGKEYGSYDIEEVKEIFYENISIQHAHNVSDFFFALINKLTIQYPKIFEGETESKAERDRQADTGFDRKYITPSEQFSKTFGWIIWVKKLSAAQRCQDDVIYKWSVPRFLNEITYLILETEVIEAETKKINARNGRG